MTVRELPDGRVVDFGDLSEEQVDQILARQHAPSSTPATPSWLSSVGREAGIAGTRILAPSAGLIHQIPGLGSHTPSYSDVLGWGPTPQGKGENILAAGATGLGYALPAAAIMLGGEAAILPEALTGVSLLANTLRPAASMMMGAGGGAAAVEARQQMLPNMPSGPMMDLGLGMLGGGLAGSMIGAPYGTAASLGLAPAQAIAKGAPKATIPRLGIASALGSLVDFAARHGLGIPPGMSYWLGQGTEIAAARGMPSMSGMGPNAASIAGGETGLLLRPPPRGDSLTMAPGQ